MLESEVKSQLFNIAAYTIKTDTAKLTEILNKYHFRLNSYIQFLAERYGVNNLGSRLIDDNCATVYKSTMTSERLAFPQHIVNAAELYKKLTASSLKREDALTTLETMALPPAIYFMLASAGLSVDKYRKAARAYIMKYPDVVEELPEPLKTLGKALLS